MKRLLALSLFAVSLQAETVYLSARGKTFHKSPACMSLFRAKDKLSVERSVALAHGLHECGICYRPEGKKKTDNSQWAKKGGK